MSYLPQPPLSLGTPRRFAQTPESRDSIVQATDADASTSRLSAVRAGYLTDPFATYFTPSSSSPVRKYPLINRGTYVRTSSIDALVLRFLDAYPRGQIISLGAGSDTRFFRLQDQSEFTYHEIDFAAVTRRKCVVVDSLEVLRTAVGEGIRVDCEKGGLKSQRYWVHPMDLRELKEGSELLEGMVSSAPTLVLSECCLIYLEPKEADGIVKWASCVFKDVFGFVLYEPVGGDDAFGKVMVQNLAARGIVLRTLQKYSSLERQKERLRALGLVNGQEAADVEWLWERWVTREERSRIAELEMVDEVEEWVLLARHYCVAWGWRGEPFWSGLGGQL